MNGETCSMVTAGGVSVAATAMPRSLVLLFAIASGLSVANVYYAQPLLDMLAQDFAISQAAVGGVVTATQAGCALALLLLVPLGDIVERRRLMLWQLLALMVALCIVALAQTTLILLVGMLATGLLGTAMTQGLIACAASAADTQERGRVVGAAQGGVFIGLLLARVFAGVVSDLAGWRAVYGASALMMLALLPLLWRHLPRFSMNPQSVNARQLMGSMLTLLCTDRVLQIRGVLAMLMFAAFTIFWSAMVLPLSAPPYRFSHTVIGLFALAGVAGALAAARAGRDADRGYGQRTSFYALWLLLLAWWPLSQLEHSLPVLLLGIVLLDLGGQALHVTNQSMILRTPAAHGRLIALYMLFYATGSGAGAIATTAVFARYGWQGVCLLGAAVSLLALVIWAITRHLMPDEHEYNNRRDEMNERDLLADADARGLRYLDGNSTRRVFPDAESIAALNAFDEPLPQVGESAEQTLALLDDIGSPATTASNGPGYLGFVVGATLPAASAAERLMVAWDQCASSFLNSPVADKVERVAGRWVLEALDLPRESAVGFGTSATACTLAALAAARRELLAREGWDIDNDGLAGAPEISVVVSELVHITVKKALRILGFGMSRLIIAPVDAFGRVDAAQLPPLDSRTILCLQAGEVNTGEFDPFAQIIPRAHEAGAWVHVDGAFGLWARASSHVALTEGIERADSWTTDAHKWLNTPYDCAMVICRDPQVLAGAMNSDAVYMSASADAQKNLTLEFSRRPRGIPVWAALRVLGRDGVREMVDRHCSLARVISEGLVEQGFEVLNRVVINQVLFRCGSDAQTEAVLAAAQASGKTWFGSTRWQGRLALRISVSSWRTQRQDVDALRVLLAKIYAESQQP